MRELKDLVRPNIQALKPYSSARDEYSGAEASVFLDANENPYNAPYNRYPDPLQKQLKRALSKVKGVPEASIFLGNGSDEAIDLVFRVFCVPQADNVVSLCPTYGMYEVCAGINDVEYRRVLLDGNYQFAAASVLQRVNARTKVIFLCTPNNPTGNCLAEEEVVSVLTNFDGIVVVDEAYSDFTRRRTFREDLAKYPRMIVLNTFSKAWGGAAIRVGMAFAAPDIVALLNKVKYPYNINLPAQQKALELLQKRFETEGWINTLLKEREQLCAAFAQLPFCKRVFPTDANFFLASVTDAEKIYAYLVRQGIIVRNRSNVALCDNCLRITIGTPQENNILLGALRTYNEQR